MPQYFPYVGCIKVNTTTYAATLGTSAATILTTAQIEAAISSNGMAHVLRITNVSASATVWITRASNITPAPNGSGSFPILPGNYELWSTPGPFPLNAVSAVATAAGTPVTIEVG